ncbi:MAG TPA: hypothetical protein EYH42_05905 [Sulfurovum sp.]|nr:hypothetical protein [Sulfurovum sp.]
MKKKLLTFLLVMGFAISAMASSQMTYQTNKTPKPIGNKQIKKMDYSHTKHKAVKRNFKTKKEFQRKKTRKLTHKPNKLNRNISNRYNQGNNYANQNYGNDDHIIRQRGHTRPNRGWLLAYRYDRASFYDSEGFYYGYFNRHGYYFEDVFYRYDRYYTFRDRLRGRGLFDYTYYMPDNPSYYGFCSTRHHPRGYTRTY